MTLVTKSNTVMPGMGLLKKIVIYCLVTAALIILGFSISTAFIEKNPLFDKKIAHFILPFTTPARTRCMIAVSFLGNYLFLLPANLVLIACCISWKNNKLAIRGAALALSSLEIMYYLKHLFHRDRKSVV